MHEVVVTAAADIADKSSTKVRLSFVPGGDCGGMTCKEHVTRAVRRRSVRGRGLFVILPIARRRCVLERLDLTTPSARVGFAGRQD